MVVAVLGYWPVRNLLMWFAARSPAYAAPWLLALLVALLDGNRVVLRLLRHNPFPLHAPPAFVRVRLPLPVHDLAQAALDRGVVGPHVSWATTSRSSRKPPRR
ncbi:hypothetical protein GCM10017771_68130 [Streptomyces capitiformicae]|uniref:Lipase maturation factor 1/2 C-terminal domain-containing protein n=1 Tax=Streptomyces capitiformicae TaxID=2014920 RepID=A0A918ZDF0_9ACTN|nr:hypothetical protein GCM10017771_68130 [Streptomyces capitiformicae]